MRARELAPSFRVGQRVVTDTRRTATVLEVSEAFNMVLLQFDNGGSSDWWPFSTLEPLTADREVEVRNEQVDRWARILARILWHSEYEALSPVRRGACVDIARYSERTMQAAR